MARFIKQKAIICAIGATLNADLRFARLRLAWVNLRRT